jgi:phosphoglycerate-specific signal transduction histidine kinase
MNQQETLNQKRDEVLRRLNLREDILDALVAARDDLVNLREKLEQARKRVTEAERAQSEISISLAGAMEEYNRLELIFRSGKSD